MQLFSSAGFSVTPNPELHRVALVLEPTIAAHQTRIGGRPTPDVGRLAQFADGLNRWLPPNAHRLLWVDHWANYFPSTYDLFIAARIGLGEKRSLLEAPGHYFDPNPHEEQDQTKISSEHAQQTGILVGLMSLFMIDRWDGWLVAHSSPDRIEFWEGNIFFYSSEKSRLAAANLLMDEFKCPRDLV